MEDLFTEEIAAMVAALPPSARDKLVAAVIWAIFVDVDNAKNAVVLPRRKPDDVDIAGLVSLCHATFFPEDFAASLDEEPAEDEEDDEFTWPRAEDEDD